MMFFKSNKFSKYILLLLVSVLMVSLYNCVAQNVDFKSVNFPGKKTELQALVDTMKEADMLSKTAKDKNDKALTMYLKANDFNPNNAILNFKIGKCSMQMPDKSKAVQYLEKAVKLDSNVNKDIHLLLGDAYHLNLQFLSAIKEYNKHKIVAASLLTPGKIKEIDKKIEECENGEKLVLSPVKVFIDNLGPAVNSKYPDYYSFVNADESMMIFTSRRENTTGGGRDEVDGGFFEDIYISYNENGVWKPPVNPGKPLNSKLHDATVGISNDGQRLFIYKDNGEFSGDIFEVFLEGDKWSKPVRLPEPINSGDHESCASFTSDEMAIYFVSDRKGGFGGKDIYKSDVNSDGTIGKPESLGNNINTEYDETGVFMHPDGRTLYFSSKGHNTMGGADIFRSVLENGVWSKPINMGYPINTPGDDLDFSITGNGHHAYYSSVKPDGLGGSDIYRITFLNGEKKVALNNDDNLIAFQTEPVQSTIMEAKINTAGSRLTLIKGEILDENNLPVEALIEITDNTTNKVIGVFSSNKKTGKYLISLPSGKNYGINVEAENYLFHSENFDIDSEEGFKEIVINIPLKKPAVGTVIVLRNVFFDFGQMRLRSESLPELAKLIKLLTKMPNLKIEISGHSDSVGSEEFNQRLSESRAKTVVEYLITNGISTSRLSYKGYGFKMPVSTNETEEGRKLNRRTEFKITAN